MSAIESAAVTLPVAFGANVILTAQLAPAAIDVPQVLVSAKFFAAVPVTAIFLTVNVAAPSFVIVTVCAALVVPTF